MKRNVQGYIYMSVVKEKEEWTWIAIKTNKDGKWMSTFGEKEEEVPITKRLQLFSNWIGNVGEYRMVAYGHENYHAFFSEIERHYANVFPRHLVRMMKAQLWNIKSECMYRFQIKEEVSIRELLFLYKQDWISHANSLVEETINLITLANMFLFDPAQTKKLMKKSKTDVLTEAYSLYNTNDLILLLFKKGYTLSAYPYQENELFVALKEDGNVVQEVIGDDLHSLLTLLLVETNPLKNS